MAKPQWKLLLGALWALLIGYWIFAAPPNDPVLEGALWSGLLSGSFGRVDASVVALFLMLGVNAELYIVLLLRDGRFQRVPGWPFGIAMFALGSFVLVPYLVLRSREPRLDRPVARVTRVLSSRPVGWLIVVAMATLAGWGIGYGTRAGFLAAFRTSALVHVMTLDFVLEGVLLWPLVEESRRLDPPDYEPSLARVLRWLPLFGPALWSALVVREQR